MLESMRSVANSWFFRILIIVLASTFIYFFSGGPSSKTEGESKGPIGNVNGTDLPRAEYQNLLQQNMEQLAGMAGGQFPEQLRQMVANQTVQQMVTGEVLRQEAERIELAVSDTELRDRIMELPYFKTNGKFDAEVYHRINRQYDFESSFRRSLGLNAYQTLITTALVVPETSLRQAFELQQDVVDVDYISIDPLQLAPKVVPSEKDLATLVQSRAADIEARFNADKTRFNIPEEVEASHILLRFPGNATPEIKDGLRKKAELLRSQITPSRDNFAKLALANSEDPGSKAKGGDLGRFRRGQMVPAFENAAFGLADGGLSEVVETPYGYHILWVRKHYPAKERSLEDVRGEIARQIAAEEKSQSLAAELASKVNDLVRSGKAEAAASILKPFDIPWQKAGLLHAESTHFGTDADSFQLNRQALALSPKKPALDAPARLGSKFIVLRCLSRKSPNLGEFETQRPTLLRAEMETQGRRLFQSYAETLRKEAKVELASEFQDKSSGLELF